MRWNNRSWGECPRGLRVAVLLLVASLAGLLLSGCITDEDPAPEKEEDQGDPEDDYQVEERDLRKDLMEEDSLPAPRWQVGDWFGLHLYFGMGDEDGEHFDAIVVDDLGSSWLLATDHEEMANMHAMWDIPMLGEIEKDDLSSTGFETTWDWMYDFPLEHEKTWTKTVNMFDFESGEVVSTDVGFTVSYAEAIETPTGDRPGFQIEGVTDEGEVMLEYDFVPEIGWFAHFYMYEPGSDDWTVHLMSMGHGEDWSGNYYLNQADIVIEHFNGIFPESPYVEGVPHGSFDVSDDAELLSGIIVLGAFTGTQQVMLAPPEGGPYHYSVDSTNDFQVQEIWIEEPAIAGTWQVASPGLGAVAFHYILLFEIQVETFDLEADGTDETAE